MTTAGYQALLLVGVRIAFGVVERAVPIALTRLAREYVVDGALGIAPIVLLAFLAVHALRVVLTVVADATARAVRALELCLVEVT